MKNDTQRERPPWDLGRVDANLVELVENRPVGNCRALDIGCGTGDNSIWLARRGFEVTGLDISALAVKKANEKALEAGIECLFLVADFLTTRIEDERFGFANALSCFPELSFPYYLFTLDFPRISLTYTCFFNKMRDT